MTRVARPNGTSSPNNGGRIVCYGSSAPLNSYQTCKRKVLWKVGEEYYCNCCFDKWTSANWDKFEPETIERLSDNERDFEFVARAAPLCQVPKPIVENGKKEEERVSV